MAVEARTDAGSTLRADARRNRDSIVKTAARHFALHGVGTSLDEIARAAGVGAGTLYRHFPSREALVAATLRDRQEDLLGRAREARAIADADAALRLWLEALQDYFRTFSGLPAPVLAAVRQEVSPLALSCDMLVSITGEFLTRAQREGCARGALAANELFLSALAMAWVLNRAESCGTTSQALNDILAHGYLQADPNTARPTDEGEHRT